MIVRTGISASDIVEVVSLLGEDCLEDVAFAYDPDSGMWSVVPVEPGVIPLAVFDDTEGWVKV